MRQTINIDGLINFLSARKQSAMQSAANAQARNDATLARSFHAQAGTYAAVISELVDYQRFARWDWLQCFERTPDTIADINAAIAQHNYMKGRRLQPVAMPD